MSSTLVAYFSASGVTARVARALAAAADADLFEIRPETPYTQEDLDWNDKHSRSSLEMADPGCRPAIEGSVADMARYSVVYVGFPIWWNREPSVVDTFLTAYDFAGKTIIPFCTSGGSGIGNTAAHIRGLVSDQATVDTGRRLDSQVSDADLKAWAEEVRP